MKRRRWWIWALQALLAGLVVLLFWQTLRAHWTDFRGLQLSVSPRWNLVLAAGAVVWLTYALLIAAWRAILLGWGERLSFGTGARIWCLSNLGRYLPGKVWSVAGLAVLARRAGVGAWAAAGSAVAMQALALGTGAVVVALAAPGAATALQVTLALAIAAATLLALLVESLAPRWMRRLMPGIELKALPPGAAIAASLATLASWFSYGLAFWLLAHGLLAAPALPWVSAAGIFAAGYLVGLIAVFAPGGVGVRELMFVALLTPVVGSNAAVILTVASRLLLTITEAGAALAALAFTRRSETGVT